jgi:hypothetical protein
MNPDEPRPVADETLARYVNRVSGPREALDDPLYAAHLKWAQDMLRIADQAMEREGVPEDARRRVASAVMFGGFDEDEAVRRIKEHAEQVEMLKREYGRLVVTPKMLAELGIEGTP